MGVREENAVSISGAKKNRRRALCEVSNRKRSLSISTLGRRKEEKDHKADAEKERVKSLLAWYCIEEAGLLPIPGYMSYQKDLRWAMRTVLVDWIIDVHYKLGLMPETLYLSVNLIDRFLSVRVVTISKLQLVGISGLLIASKYQEIVSPSIETFVVLTDRSFCESDILRAEKYMLHCLDYRIGSSSPLYWVRACTSHKEALRLGTVILDLAFLDEVFLRFRFSILGCSVSYIAQTLVRVRNMEEFRLFCGYTLEELGECIRALKTLLSRPVVHESIFKKHGVFFTRYLENISCIQSP